METDKGGLGGGKLSFKGTASILQARDRIDQESGLESVAAFHRWRMASLKTQYARQLRGILSDVQKDEQRLKEAQVLQKSTRPGSPDDGG